MDVYMQTILNREVSVNDHRNLMQQKPHDQQNGASEPEVSVGI